ncbi:ankyrin repeat domain-containing protein 46-like [Saccostrea cucullata]|uniref:ankyrin repeat domain-containing protein 46-like n=1 Tax=Saccostrea cuccullata TaxID=36930 RepID=UPI002ED08DA0
MGILHSLWNWTDRDSRGATPLHYACCKGNIEMIDSLKNLGAAFDMIAFNGSTPLHSAAICKQYDVLNYLLSLYPKPPPDNETNTNKLGKEMVKKVSISTIEEIQKWQGIRGVNSFITLQQTDLADTDAPLEPYDKLADDQEIP